MSPYPQILYQIVFSPKNRNKVLIKKNREHLCRDIWGILKNNNCHRYPINGIEDHLNSVTQLHSSVARAALVKAIKLGSATLMKHEGLFPNFNGWQQGLASTIMACIHIVSFLINLKDKGFLYSNA